MKLILLIITLPLCAQVTFTRPVVRGTTVPMSCAITGQLFIDTDAAAGQNLYVCNGSTFDQYTGTGGGGGNLTIKTGSGDPNTGMETCTDPAGGTLKTVYFQTMGDKWWDCVAANSWELRLTTSGVGDTLITFDDQASTPPAPSAGLTNVYTISGRLASRTSGGAEVQYAPNTPIFLTGAATADLPNEVSLGGDDAVGVGNGSTVEAKTLPNCPDTGGNHLNYTQSTNAFNCGTSSSGGGGTCWVDLGLGADGSSAAGTAISRGWYADNGNIFTGIPGSTTVGIVLSHLTTTTNYLFKQMPVPRGCTMGASMTVAAKFTINSTGNTKIGLAAVCQPQGTNGENPSFPSQSYATTAGPGGLAHSAVATWTVNLSGCDPGESLYFRINRDNANESGGAGSEYLFLMGGELY